MGSRFLNGPRPVNGKAASLVANERAPVKVAPKPKPKKVALPPTLNPKGDKRFVTVREHQRAIPVKKAAPVVNTAKAEPATKHGESKRFYRPLEPGQKPSGYEPVGRRPGRAGIGSPVKSRPYWLATRGPVGDTKSQLSSAQLKKAEKAGPGKSLGIKALDAAVHPLTDLGRQASGARPFSAKGAASDVANIASNFVGPEKAGAAAGIFGLGKALKGAKVAEEAAVAGKAAVNAKATTKAAPYVAHGQEGVELFPSEVLPRGYSYHRSTEPSLAGIRKEGLRAAAPGPHAHKVGDVYGTYFANHPLRARSLSGKELKGSIFLRTKTTNLRDVIERVYAEHVAPHSVPPEHLEYFGADKQWHPVVGEGPTAQQQLREGLKGSASVYGKEKAARKIEAAARAEDAAAALRAISDPDEALAASGKAMRGKYATIDYKGLTELNPQTVKQLMSVAQHHPGLGMYQKRTVMKALRLAVDEGRNPRPAELRDIQMVFGKKTAAGLVKQAKRTLYDRTIDVLNIPRALQTTGDISGLFRQNLVAGVSHPVIWGRSFPKAFTSMTEKGFAAEKQAMEADPFYHQFLQSGGRMTDIGEHADMVAHPEGFQSDLAADALDKVPKVPNVIKGSARSYVTTGNYMRLETFKNRMRIGIAAGDKSIHDPEKQKQIAAVINAATGFGTLPGRADHLLPAMNTFLFSPRLMLSRIHYMDPTWYFRLKGPARREALRGLFALAGSVTGALYLFDHIPGVEVDWKHPQSADWGKMKIGNTRVDIAGGFQQYVRLASELAPAALGGDRTYSANTGEYTKLGSGYGKPTRLSVGLNFVGNKLSPVPGFVVNAARGHDAVGNKLTWESAAQNYLTPFGFQDAHSVFNDKQGGKKGIEFAAAAYGLSALGLGLQTYKAREPKGRGGSSGSRFLPGSSSGNGSVFLP